ncbi:cytochrome P450 3A13-like, partial [Oppia nitens]|uniref:cytochrome P450 3A13-like n=1 Tax=Oppia nitens TaxID=1686743 RepID=UPI0023DC4423
FLYNNLLTNPLIIAIICSLYAIYRYYASKYTYWETQGVRTAPFGYWQRLYKRWFKWEQELYGRYGKCFGVYESTRPVLYLADPDLIRDVLVKDFHIFTNRRDISTGLLMDKILPNLKSENWKRVRTVVSPTFTLGKLRKMLPLIGDCLKTLDRNLDTAAKTTTNRVVGYDMKRLFCAYSMEVILQVSFGIKVDAMMDADNPIIVNACKLLSHEFGPMLYLLMFVPRLAHLMKLSIFDTQVIEFFHQLSLQVIEERRQKSLTESPGTAPKRVDLLQLMLDSINDDSTGSSGSTGSTGSTGPEFATHSDDKVDEKYREYSSSSSSNGRNNSSNTTNNNNNNNKTDSFKKYLTNDELIASCVVFFVAGFENIITTLSNATHLLAANPDCQQRLYDEVADYFRGQHDRQSDESIADYETLHSLKYLDAVIKETLRLYPNSIALEREASDDYQLGGPDNGIQIRKGQLIHILTYSIHHDPANYPEPYRFRPERFLPENQTHHPYTYLPFGGGPRNCIGMRLAQMIVKQALVNAVHKYSFHDTGKPLEFYKYQVFGIMTPKEVFVRVEKRQ